MKKSDLKVNMIVEQREGCKFILMRFKKKLYMVSAQEYDNLDFYTDDLKEPTNTNYDIVKIYQPNNVWDLKESFWDQLTEEQLIWERKENKNE